MGGDAGGEGEDELERAYEDESSRSDFSLVFAKSMIVDVEGRAGTERPSAELHCADDVGEGGRQVKPFVAVATKIAL